MIHQRGKRMLSLAARNHRIQGWTDSPTMIPTMPEKLGKRARRLLFDDGEVNIKVMTATNHCSKWSRSCRLIKM